MRAKEDAKNAKPQQPIMHPGDSQGGGGSDVERPAVPVAKGKGDSTQQQQDGEMEEIPIAGRTKMTVPKIKDQGVQGVGSGSSSGAGEEQVDHTEAKSELNDILKRAPGM